MRVAIPDLSWPTATGRPPASIVVPLVAVVALLLVAAPLAEISPVRLLSSLGKLAEFAGHFFAGPDWSYAGNVAAKLLETIEMAFLGTVIAVVLSLPIGLLAARNSTPCPAVAHGLRFMLTLMRSLP